MRWKDTEIHVAIVRRHSSGRSNLMEMLKMQEQIIENRLSESD